MATLALLVCLAAAHWPHAPAPGLRALRAPAAAGLAAVAVQIALGGWVSANYAALACTDFPLCLGKVVPPMDFADAFHVLRELGKSPEGDALSREALTAIHWTHRMFALVATAAAGWAAWRAWRTRELRALGAALGALLALQVALGIGNVLAGLPLWLAAAHNAGAALLLAALVVLNFFSFHQLRPQRA
jgi:cytochrome c oxidase assembly protein subunit 15